MSHRNERWHKVNVPANLVKSHFGESARSSGQKYQSKQEFGWITLLLGDRYQRQRSGRSTFAALMADTDSKNKNGRMT
jgi:hypothetical protein